MQTVRVLETILMRENISAQMVSLSMGRNRTYLRSVIAQKLQPRADTLATILDAMNYDLVAKSRDDGYEIAIDPLLE